MYETTRLLPAHTTDRLAIGKVVHTEGGRWGFVEDIETGEQYFWHVEQWAQAFPTMGHTEHPLVIVGSCWMEKPNLKLGDLIRFKPGMGDRGPKATLWLTTDAYLAAIRESKSRTGFLRDYGVRA